MTAGSKAALAGVILGTASIGTLAVAGIGYRLGWLQLGTALKVSEWAVYAATLGVVMSIIGAVVSWSAAPGRAFMMCFLGVAVSLPAVAIAAQWEYATRTYPPINDISTDTQDPPVFWDMPNPTMYPAGKSAEMQRAAYPDLGPLQLSIPPDRAFARALAQIKNKGWEIVAAEQEEGRIEAIERSFLFGFKDEVVVRILESGGGARIDMRSRSRIGNIDRGVNAKRIRSFLAELRSAD